MEEILSIFNFNFGPLLGKIGVRTLFLVISVEEAGVPLPISGDLFLLTAGRNSLYSHFSLLKVLAATLGGTILGASFLYFLSRTLGRTLILKYGHYLRIEEASLVRVGNWVQKHGGIMIFLGRIFPGFRITTSIMAGILKVHYAVFLFYTTLATIVWTAALFWAGRFLGGKLEFFWTEILSRPYLTLPGTVVGAIFFIFLFRKIAKLKQKRE